MSDRESIPLWQRPKLTAIETVEAINTAEGDALDEIGMMLAVPRLNASGEGPGVEEYRRILIARVEELAPRDTNPRAWEPHTRASGTWDTSEDKSVILRLALDDGSTRDLFADFSVTGSIVDMRDTAMVRAGMRACRLTAKDERITLVEERRTPAFEAKFGAV